MNKKPRSINGLVLLAVLGLVLVWLIMTGTGEQTSSVRYSQIISWFEQGEVTDFTLDLTWARGCAWPGSIVFIILS